ncbi:MAG: threonine/serine dehydratase [Anaerolineae bacterium]|nr:threonine/serine dehydratase [Anaerolineae bacterium]MDQ7033267.1 threonine/serine dehydratase [Anaerolineae bacterium]
MIPKFTDVLAARQRIIPYLSPTPTHRYQPIDDLIGTAVYIKHENYQPVGAFKIRGGINLVSQLSDDERKRGLIGASTGNHGQSIARAGQLFGVAVKIVVPQGANLGKVAAMRGFGAEVIFHGENFDDAVHHVEELTAEFGYRYVHSGNEPHLIAGVGTETLELLEAAPNLDVLYVPIGGGSGAAGTCIVAKTVNPNIRVVGVQSTASPAAYESWRSGQIEIRPNKSIAEGLATGHGFELPQEILQKYLDDFVLVSDESILQAMVWMLERAHTLAEAAGASPLAAMYQARNQLQGKTVGMICSGGNTSLTQLKQAIDFSLQKSREV